MNIKDTNTTLQNNLNHQKGLSLIEILVTLVISIFLMGGIIQVYLGNKTAYKFSNAISHTQENGRFALDSISTDIRMAGFWGCTDLESEDKDGDGFLQNENPQVQNHLNDASANFAADRHDFIEMPSITATVDDGLNDSDTLTLRGAKAGQSAFTANFSSPGDGAIQVAENSSLRAGDILLITNCYSADIFEATSVSNSAGISTITHTTAAGSSDSPGNKTINACPGVDANCLLSQNDRPFTPSNAALFSLQTVTYSIQASEGNTAEPALWRSVNNVDEELIEGIENLQILFGVDTDGDGSPNQYQESAAVVNLQQVTAVRIWLVARSERDNVNEKEQTYTINGETITSPDKRMRQVFSMTIALRNKEA